MRVAAFFLSIYFQEDPLSIKGKFEVDKGILPKKCLKLIGDCTVPYYFFSPFNLPSKAVIARRHDEAICSFLAEILLKMGRLLHSVALHSQ